MESVFLCLMSRRGAALQQRDWGQSRNPDFARDHLLRFRFRGGEPTLGAPELGVLFGPAGGGTKPNRINLSASAYMSFRAPSRRSPAATTNTFRVSVETEKMTRCRWPIALRLRKPRRRKADLNDETGELEVAGRDLGQRSAEDEGA